MLVDCEVARDEVLLVRQYGGATAFDAGSNGALASVIASGRSSNWSSSSGILDTGGGDETGYGSMACVEVGVQAKGWPT